MKTFLPPRFSLALCPLITLLLASPDSALAAVRYVDVNSASNAPPYTTWATAATNIQDAVDAAVAGDEIVVTNGIYATGGRDGNRLAVDKPLTLRSLNGPQFTMIDGGHSNLCVFLTDSASLSGFTLTNGIRGVYCPSRAAVVSNCVVTGNSTPQTYSGDTGPAGGGASGGTLNNCILSGNGAVATDVNGHWQLGSGGGAFNATLNSCTLSGNFAKSGGAASGCTLNNCTLTGNRVWGTGIRQSNPGYGGGAANCTLNNCTLVGNLADDFDGPAYGGGAYGCTLNNCIAYFNDGGNYDSSTLNYSCAIPLPTIGFGNITNAPLFVNFAAGNYRLRPDSPCIDAGTNLSASITNDLDGRPRPLDGNGDGLAAFDMGAYEYRTPLLVWQDSPNPTPPHADWTTAAHTIQDAVDAAVAGDEIVVTNGIYATGGRAADGDSTTNRVAVDKPLSLRSINGPQFTIIDGSHSVRCGYLTAGASLSGFTLTNGRAFRGAGLWCESTNSVASNCVVSGNHTYSFEDRGPSGTGGGAHGGTLNNCALSSNAASSGGGAYDSMLNNCTLTGNSVAGSQNSVAPALGGGAVGCILNNCTLAGNSAIGHDFGVGAGGGGAAGCTLNNCTLTGNWVADTRGRAYGPGVYGGTLNNCIVYFNGAPGAANYSGGTFNYSCTMPQPTSGFGNITNAPLFVDLAAGNLRLQSNSPCINAGLNAFAPAGPDLDGNPRIVRGTVDIGAYEFQGLGSVISYAWLQQYALPTDGSADSADPDGDRMNNWQEWRCATDPTNALSVLRMLAPTAAGSDLLVRWESVANRTYFLERSADASSAFTLVATDIPGQPGTTAHTHTNAVGAGPWFYRVGIEE